MIPRRYSKKSSLTPAGGKGSPPDTRYVFRYTVGDRVCPSFPDLRELLAGHLRGLLDLLTPTRQGKKVFIDGYRCLGEPDVVHPLFTDEKRDSNHSDNRLELYEPRLTYIQKLINSLLSVVDLEHQKRTVRIDGFRLKKPGQWLRPGGGAADLLALAATRCNLKCRFCYNLGSPPALQAVPRRAEEEFQDIMTRIAYYVPASKLGFSPDAGSPCEMLTHPHILEILAALRKKTAEVLRIPTNGAGLTPEVVQALVPFEPVFIDVSLNSSSAVRRRWLMGDPHPETALGAPAALRSARIPYSLVIVPWPFPSLEEMVADLVRTVNYSVEFSPACIQISLPGYSTCFSQEPLFDREEVWNRLKDEIQHLRTAVDCPLILRPGLFEEYLDPEAVDVPRLIGVVKNSPAAKAGVQPGDRLTGINGLPVKNRIQARSLLKMIQESSLGKVSVAVTRGGGRLDLSMALNDFGYPFDPRMVPYEGCVFPSAGIPRDWMEKLRNIILEEQAREVLILTSTLVRPMLEKRIREDLFLTGVKFHLRVPANSYFGGNIFMGDLLVVEDFIGAVKKFLKERPHSPDLVIIPSSPFHISGWGRDLTGRVYKDIERVTGIPVSLIECDPIFD
jgi:membrane-associated protease RseP (regulator of RpoE activity)